MTNQKTVSPLKNMLSLAMPYKVYFLIACILALLLSVLGPLRPYLVKLTVDNYILHGNKEGLIKISILLIIVLLLESIIRYIFTYLTTWMGQTIIKELRVRVYNHITKMKIQYYDKTPIGASTTRTINDTEAINEVFSQGLVTIVSELVTIIVILGFMFYMNWQLTLYCMASLPVMIIATYVFKEKIKQFSGEIRMLVSKMNAFVQEHIIGMSVVQIFNAQKKEFAKFDAINKAHTQVQIQQVFYYSIFFPLVEIVSAMSIAILVWNGSSRVIDGEIELGVLISFLLYIYMLFRPIRILGERFNTLQMGLVASGRVFNILNNKDFIEDTGTDLGETIKGDIQFKNVSFAYTDEDYVLKNVSFDIKEGQTLALVGATGSGKTSIINILNRFYEFQKGEIILDGKDIKSYDLSALRSKISMVLQDVFLFTGTIHDNITLKNENISREKVIEIAKLLEADKFIESLPGTYDYNVLERGASLSVGQRQLISFIRALVYNPSILILDEATSSIDTESELLIEKAIEKMVSGRTSIIIAHRLSTIKRADKIIVLDKGEIKEQGTHNELLKKKGYYYKLQQDLSVVKKQAY